MIKKRYIWRTVLTVSCLIVFLGIAFVAETIRLLRPFVMMSEMRPLKASGPPLRISFSVRTVFPSGSAFRVRSP